MSVLNPANLLTVLRLGLTPWVIAAILEQRTAAALVLLLAAGVSDALDGPLARRRQTVTRLGAYLDPIADKLLLSGSYLAMAVRGLAPAWLVALIFGRDLLILAMAAAALLFTRIREFRPSVWGKASTVTQVVTGVALLVAAGCPWPAWSRVAGWLIWVAAAATAISGLDYLRQAVVRLGALRRGATM